MIRLKKRLLSILLAVLVALGICYVGIAGYILHMGHSLAFKPPPPGYAPDTCLYTLSRTGDRIAYRHHVNPEARRTILYSHGSSVDIEFVDYICQFLVKDGVNVLVYDYPGIGHSSGELSEDGTYAAIEAVYTVLTEGLGIRPVDIIAYGRSVGCAPTLHLAGLQPDMAEVVLVSPFLSPLTIVTGTPIFAGDLFKNYQTIRKVQRPIYILHGTEDATVPFSHAERLHALAPQSTFIRIDGYGHGNIHNAPEHEALVQRLIASPEAQ